MFRGEDDLVPVQVIVTLWVKQGRDVQEVISEMDYDFNHEAIVDTEIREVNTEI